MRLIQLKPPISFDQILAEARMDPKRTAPEGVSLEDELRMEDLCEEAFVGSGTELDDIAWGEFGALQRLARVMPTPLRIATHHRLVEFLRVHEELSIEAASSEWAAALRMLARDTLGEESPQTIRLRAIFLDALPRVTVAPAQDQSRGYIVEYFNDVRIATFLLNDALTPESYDKARIFARALGVDPDTIEHVIDWKQKDRQSSS